MGARMALRALRSFRRLLNTLAIHRTGHDETVDASEVTGTPSRRPSSASESGSIPRSAHRSCVDVRRTFIISPAEIAAPIIATLTPSPRLA